MSQLHKCPVGGCIVQVRHDLLMCKQHWFMVPAPLRDAVMKTWRRGNMRPYMAARQAAIKAVDDIITPPASRQAGPAAPAGGRTSP